MLCHAPFFLIPASKTFSKEESNGLPGCFGEKDMHYHGHHLEHVQSEPDKAISWGSRIRLM